MRVMQYVSRLALASVVLAAVLVGATACQRSESGKETVPVETAAEPLKVSVQQVRDWMDEGTQLVVLDSRSAGGWDAATIRARGAIRVPPNEVETHLESIPGEGRIIVYCT